ncbi:MAG: DNA-binding protein [Phototrophicales bacterium]|nr:MAG: DNA-binding protein [Phototrophicales bacterium]
MTFPFDPIARWWVNGRTQNRSYDDLIAMLETGMKRIEKRAHAAPTDKYHALWTHIIGIEIWSQKKLAIALGEPAGEPEYMPYRPSKDTAWDDLLPLMRQTRAETIALAKRLSQANIAPQMTIHHNDWGDLTVKGWLMYIYLHADFEIKKIR